MQFTSMDFFNIVLTPVRIRWTVPLKGQYSLKSIKLVSAFNDRKNQLCRINVASAANSLYWYANFYNPIYTGKLISGTATYRLLVRRHQLPKTFNVRYAFVAGELMSSMQLQRGANFPKKYCMRVDQFSEIYKLAHCYKFFAAGANFINQS